MTKLGRKEFSSRRAMRMSEHGRAFESTVEEYLQQLLDFGQIREFTRHPPCSPEDYSGRDFTVVKEIEGVLAERSFGVTISIRSWHKSISLHPDYPQFCFPIGTKKETVVRRILELFQEPKPC